MTETHPPFRFLYFLCTITFTNLCRQLVSFYFGVKARFSFKVPNKFRVMFLCLSHMLTSWSQTFPFIVIRDMKMKHKKVIYTFIYEPNHFQLLSSIFEKWVVLLNLEHEIKYIDSFTILIYLPKCKEYGSNKLFLLGERDTVKKDRFQRAGV